MSTTFSQNFSPIDDEHKEISLSKETDFKTKTKTSDAWISLNINPNDMKFLSYIYSYMIYKITKPQTQKTRSGTEFSKAHNSHKTYPFLLKL
jgi:hypothetical protein